MSAAVAVEVVRARATLAIDGTGLAKRYGRAWALAGVDVAIAPGERVFVVGDNGSGKSTLLRLLAGATRPTRGTLYVVGRGITPGVSAIRRQLSYVPDRPAMYGELTALENLRFSAVMHGVPSAPATLWAGLETVGLRDAAHTQVRALSRGMRQRLALAAATLRDTPLVLLDEPYAALDADGTTWLDAWLDVLRDRGTTVVLATHQITTRAAAGGRVLTLRAGRMVSDRPSRWVGESPAPRAAPTTEGHDWQRALAVAWKDLRTERRARAALSAMAAFAVLVLFLFGLALGAVPDAVPGLIWVTTLLASLLALDRSSQIEIEHGGWDALRATPGARWPIYAGKVLSTSLLLSALAIVLVPSAVILYNLPIPGWPALMRFGLAAVLAIIGLAGAGTLYTALITDLRARQALLPLLLFPVMVPILLAAVKVTTLAWHGDPLGEIGGWTKLLVAADSLYLTTGALAFGAVLDD